MLYSIRGLKHTYGDRTVLDIPDLEIQAGKIYTLLGSNGAGKTTLLNILGFLETPTTGEISFSSHLVNFRHDLQRFRRRVVLVDQYPVLFTGPVWKNVEFGLRVRKVAKKQRQAIVEEKLAMVGMQDFANADAHKLSGGETKRIALARALALEPEVLLCDEPTANVDVQNQEILLKILEKSNKEDGLSLIFATHYFSQGQRLADKTIILQNGQLSETARDNVFHVLTIESGDGTVVLQIDEVHRLITHHKSPPGLGQKADVYIDPQQVGLYSREHSPGCGDNAWQGEICRIERENNLVRITVDTGLRLDVLLSKERYCMRPFIVGETVTLHIPEGALSFFL